MKRTLLIICVLIMSACANASNKQNAQLTPEQQIMAQENPCKFLSTFGGETELRAYGEGVGIDQWAAYTEARIKAESELLRMVNGWTNDKIDSIKANTWDTPKNKKKRSKRKTKRGEPVVETLYFMEGSLRGVRPILVKYHPMNSLVLCRVCLSIDKRQVANMVQTMNLGPRQYPTSIYGR